MKWTLLGLGFAAGLAVGYRLPAWLERGRQWRQRRRAPPPLLRPYRPDADVGRPGR